MAYWTLQTWDETGQMTLPEPIVQRRLETLHHARPRPWPKSRPPQQRTHARYARSALVSWDETGVLGFERTCSASRSEGLPLEVLTRSSTGPSAREYLNAS